MSATTAKTAGTVVSTGSWTGFTTTNLATNDTNRATNASATYTSGVLRNFDFQVPTNATILGIVVNFYLSTSNTAATAYGKIRISKNAGTNWSAYSTEQSQATTTDTSKTVGGATDMWGLTLTAEEINNNTNFYVEVAGYISNTARTCRVTYVGVTVYYKQVYTLDASVTSYSLTGVNAILGRKYTLTTQATAYTLTTVNANLNRRYVMATQVTAYTLTPVNAILGKRYTLTAQNTAFTLTTVNTVITKRLTLSASATSFTITGIDAELTYVVYVPLLDKIPSLVFSLNGSPWVRIAPKDTQGTQVDGLSYTNDGSPWWGHHPTALTWAIKTIKAYIGGAWTTKPLKWFNGSIWTAKDIKKYG